MDEKLLKPEFSAYVERLHPRFRKGFECTIGVMAEGSIGQSERRNRQKEPG